MKRYLEHRLKLRMLRALDMIEKHKSLLRAGQELGVTQPALTRTLQEVEDILGARVFERHARGMRPTPFGAVACEAARRVLAEVERFDQSLNEFLGSEASVVAIGATPPAAVGILPDIYETLRVNTPAIRINVTQGRTEDLLPLLASGEIEMIVGRLPPAEEATSFTREVLYSEPISVLASTNHPIFSEAVITLDTLRRYTYVLPTMSQPVEREIDAIAASLSLQVALRASSLPFMREVLHSSDHLTISPHFTMAGDLRRGSIRRVPFDLPVPTRAAGLLMRPGDALRPAAKALYETLRTYFRAAEPA